MKLFSYSESLLNACAEQSMRVADPMDEDACEKLFHQHAKHFERVDMDKLSPRFERFVQSVLLVYEHNSRTGDNHRIGLNQFSDRYDDEFPLKPFDDVSVVPPLDSLDESVVVNLSSYETIIDAAKGMQSQHVSKRSRQGHFEVKTHGPKQRLEVLKATHGQKQHYVIGQIPSLYIDDTTTDDRPTEDDEFKSYLNWATAENPDGVPIVHPPSDQGSCGSCWAYAATGTLEASASRRAAYETYLGFVNGEATLKVSDTEAEDLARRAERDAIEIADLSVQELIDCDTAFDQGCIGGNPVLAFDFIHRYGLTSSKNYPYIGKRKSCLFKTVANPIATVKSWGILTPNHEDNMELVLRLIGPIAVGINGSDLSFLAYQSGIYNSLNCVEVPNHALLIVGYGQEVDTNGDIVRFWIARNSWGESWGEKGYVRIRRGSGRLGDKSVCGIAKGPSVALGGVLLNGVPASSIRKVGAAFHIPSKLEKSLHSNYCRGLAFGHFQGCDFKKIHLCPAIMYGAFIIFAMFAFAAWNLTKYFRTIMRYGESQRPTQDGNNYDESTRHLLSTSPVNHETYGTSNNMS